MYDINDIRNNAKNSDNTRMFYSLKLLAAIDINSVSFIFGNGANSSLEVIGHTNIKPHNDFLRMLYDYGILFLLLYIIFLYKIFVINRYTAYLVIIYMFSFYHNMVFDFYTLVLLLIFSKIKFTTKQYREFQ
jgi:hypothetical protein